VTALRNRWLFDYHLTRSGLSLWPRKVVLEITHQCNLRCFMCSLYGMGDSESIRAREFDPRDLMTLAERKALVDDVAGFRPLIAFSGGEPLLYKECVSLVRHVKARRLPCIVLTNGVLLSERAEGLVESGLDAVAVSLDGPEAVHDEIRGVPGSFARACQGIREVQRVRERLGRRRPKVNVTYCISNKNYARLSEFLQIAADLQVDELTFSHLWFTTEEAAQAHNRRFTECGRAFAENLAALPNMDVSVLADQIELVRKAHVLFPVVFMPELIREQIASYYRHPPRLIWTDRCAYPWLVIRVLPNGDLIPCLGLVIGNVKRDPFRVCWNGEKMRRFRRRVCEVGAFPVCARCCGLFEQRVSRGWLGHKVRL